MRVEDYLKLYKNSSHAVHVKNLCLQILMKIEEILNTYDKFLDYSDEIYKPDLTEHSKILETAALLHDIGHNQNLENHALYGSKLIFDKKKKN